MNIEKKIVSNIKKEDEDDFEYEYVLEIEHFNSYKILKQVSYKETWNRLLKRFTLMDNCFNEKNDNLKNETKEIKTKDIDNLQNKT